MGVILELEVEMLVAIPVARVVSGFRREIDNRRRHQPNEGRGVRMSTSVSTRSK